MALTQEQKIKEISKIWGLGIKETKEMIDRFKKMLNKDFQDVYEEATGKEEIKIILMADAEKYQKVENIIPTGFPALDDPMKGGIAVGSTAIIAAPSGHGKTAFMVTMSYYFLKQDIKCLWFSYEESNADVWERFKKIGLKTGPAFCPLELTDNKLDFIEKTIKKFKKKNKLFIVFIDQLSFLAPKMPKDLSIESVSGNYSMYLGLISQQLKDMAMKYGVIIVFAHQLGRSGELSYSEAVKNPTSKALYLNRETAPQNSTEEFTEKSYITFKKNRVPGGGKNPRIVMTVKNGLFTPLTSLEDYATDNLGWKKEEVNLNI